MVVWTAARQKVSLFDQPAVPVGPVETEAWHDHQHLERRSFNCNFRQTGKNAKHLSAPVHFRHQQLDAGKLNQSEQEKNKRRFYKM